MIITFFQENTFAEYAFRIILAGICGFSIGYERSVHQKAAGVRTHVVVCCASALFMIVSKYGFMDISTIVGVSDADPSRIAAQVVTGISFLGAGVIFMDGNAIKGLTTAAGIWSTAAIGLAVGAGMYFISIFVTIVLTLYMVIMHIFRIGRDALIDYRVIVTARPESDVFQIFREEIIKRGGEVMKMRMIKTEEGNMIYRIRFKIRHDSDVVELLKIAELREDVLEITGNIV